MAIAKTKLVKVELVVGENTGEATIQNTVRLNRDATKVFRIDAKLVDVKASVLLGQVLIEGTLHKQIFFVGADDRIYHQGEDVPFSAFVAVPCAINNKDMKAHVRWRIEKVNFTLDVTSNLLLQQVIVQFFVKVTQDAQVNVFLSNTGPLLKADAVVGENVISVCPVSEVVLERPAIKVREVFADIRDVKADVLEGCVSVQGTLHAQIFYVADDQIAYHQSVDLPFNTVIDVAGADFDMKVEVNAAVARVERIILQDNQTLQLRSIVQVFVKVTEDAQVCVETLPTGPLVRTFRVIAEKVQQALFENAVELSIPAQKVQDIEARVTDLTFEVLTNKIIITGIIHKQIFFVGEDDVLHHQPEDIPFSTCIDMPGACPGMKADVHARIDHLSWVLTNRPDAADVLISRDTNRLFAFLQQRIVIEFFVKISEEVQINIRAVENVPAQLVAAIPGGGIVPIAPGVAPGGVI